MIVNGADNYREWCIPLNIAPHEMCLSERVIWSRYASCCCYKKRGHWWVIAGRQHYIEKLAQKNKKRPYLTLQHKREIKNKLIIWSSSLFTSSPVDLELNRDFNGEDYEYEDEAKLVIFPDHFEIPLPNIEELPALVSELVLPALRVFPCMAMGGCTHGHIFFT